MATSDRPFAEVLQDIIRNFQDIVRSEVRLAKAEIGEEAVKAKAAGLMIGAGAVTGHFSILFLLLALFFALSLALPNWAAALIIGTVLALIAGVTINAGLKLFKQVHPAPEHTINSLKENVEWAKQQSK